MCLCVRVCADAHRRVCVCVPNAHQHDGHVLHPTGSEVVVTHVEHMQTMLLLSDAHSNVSQTDVLARGGGGHMKEERRGKTQE